MIKKLLTAKLILIATSLLFVPTVFASSFESNSGVEIDQWSGSSSNYPVGQVFTASSDHTITSFDLMFSGILHTPAVSGYMHVAHVSGGVPTTDIAVSSYITSFSSGSIATGVFSCQSLSSGTDYAVYFVADTSPLQTIVGTVGSGLVYYSPTWNSFVESTNFTVYGDAGACAGGGGSGTTTPVAATNPYIFLLTSYGIFLVQLFGILILFYIIFATIGWPIRMLVRAFTKIIKRSER